MGLGGTAKKIQQMVDMAEKLYERLNEVREQLTALRATVEETGSRVEALERENAKQRALLTALAEEEGVDVEAVLDGVGETGGTDGTEADGADADGAGTAGTDGAETGGVGTDAGETADPTASENVDNNP